MATGGGHPPTMGVRGCEVSSPTTGSIQPWIQIRPERGVGCVCVCDRPDAVHEARLLHRRTAGARTAARTTGSTVLRWISVYIPVGRVWGTPPDR